MTSCETHKHIGLLLDKKLAFDNHVEEMILRVNKDIGLITRLRRYLPRNSLLIIYKAFIRPHLDYGDVVYDYPGNASFAQNLESVQYNASLAITSCFRDTPRYKLYSELGLESLADRQFYRRLFSQKSSDTVDARLILNTPLLSLSIFFSLTPSFSLCNFQSIRKCEIWNCNSIWNFILKN